MQRLTGRHQRGRTIEGFPGHSRAPGDSSPVELHGNEKGKRAEKRKGTLERPSGVRSANENLRWTFVFHAGHVDTFLPLGRNGTRRTTGRASAMRQSLSPRFRNKPVDA